MRQTFTSSAECSHPVLIGADVIMMLLKSRACIPYDIHVQVFLKKKWDVVSIAIHISTHTRGITLTQNHAIVTLICNNVNNICHCKGQNSSKTKHMHVRCIYNIQMSSTVERKKVYNYLLKAVDTGDTIMLVIRRI